MVATTDDNESQATTTASVAAAATGAISGLVFLDQNADGIQESGDANLSGIAVSLLNASGNSIATTTTNSTGGYSFAGLTVGSSYFVQFTAPTGDDLSPAPTTASYSLAAGKTSAITATSAGVTGIDAGVYAPVSLSGTVFTDNNGNGLVDGTDKGLGGVTVQLLNAQGNPTGTTAVTASDGTYSFTNLAPGTYSVHVELPTTPQGEVFSAKGSNTAPQPTGGTQTTEQNLLVNGSFEDGGAAGTGVGTTAEGFTGWTVSANAPSTPYGSGPGNGPEIALTNGSSAIAIDPKGDTNSYAAIVSPDNADPYYDGGSGTHAAFFVDDGAIETLSQSVTLTGGQIYEVGFDLNYTIPGASNPGGYELQASIGGQVITTAGSTAGKVLQAGTWNHFADLFTPATTGTYTLTFTYMSGTVGTTQTAKDVLVDDVYIVPGQVTPNLTTTSEVDSNGDTAPVTLTSGQTVGNESAGIFLPATITGTVFNDLNADGVEESGDAGLSNQTVNLLGSDGKTVIATTTTNGNGVYTFSRVVAGSDTVQFVVQPGDTFSTANSVPVTATAGSSTTVNAGEYAGSTITGTVFNDLNADAVQESGEFGIAGQTVNLIGPNGKIVGSTTTAANGGYSFTGVAPGADTVQVIANAGAAFSTPGNGVTPVTLISGSSTVVNAGEYLPATISGTVFSDSNDDGIQESGDSGSGGQTVNLLGPDGKTVMATATTTPNGTYSFTSVTPGADTIQIMAPAGYTFSPIGNSNSLPDSNVGPAGTAAVTVTSGSCNTVNAGICETPTIPRADIDGHVFVDNACTGVYHVGDAYVPGVTVELLDANGKTVQTVTTDDDGDYSFDNVVAGSYSEKFILPAGLSFVSQRAGSDDTINSAPDATTGATTTFTVAGTNIDTENAGVYLNGNFAGATPTTVGDNQSASINNGGAIVVGGSNDNIHTTSGSNFVTMYEGSNVFESGSGTDIVYSCGTLNAQALGSGQTEGLGYSDYIFGGSGPNDLQGGAGSDYLMGGPGNDLIAGGNSGPNVLIGGGNTGTVTYDANGDVTGYTVGDEIRPGAAPTTIIFQKGDHVDLLDTFQPGQDTLEIYGYSASDAHYFSGVDGHTVLSLGPAGSGDLIVFNSSYDESGNGIVFNPNVAAAPQLVLHVDANGLPYFTAPSSTTTPTTSQPVLSSLNDVGEIDATAPDTTLVANNGATFTLVGGSGGGCTLQGGTGNDTLSAQGTGNTIDAGDGNNTINTGAGGASVTAGNGENSICVNGTGNSVTAGNGNNNVLLTSGASGDITLGNGANTLFAYSGDGLDIQAGSGANTVYAQINDSTLNLGAGQAFVFGNNDNIQVAGSSPVVSVTGDNADISGASGKLIFAVGNTASVTLAGQGSNEIFATGSGDVMALSGGCDNTVIGGTGGNNIAITGSTASNTQLIGLAGTGNTVAVGDGNATIFAGQGGDNVTAGKGSDVVVLGAGDNLTIGGGSNQEWLGGGNDVVKLSAFGSNDIYFFGSTSKLDLSTLIGSIQTSAVSDLTKCVSVTTNGQDTLVGLTGGTLGNSITNVADLHGMAVSSVSALQSMLVL